MSGPVRRASRTDGIDQHGAPARSLTRGRRHPREGVACMPSVCDAARPLSPVVRLSAEPGPTPAAIGVRGPDQPARRARVWRRSARVRQQPAPPDAAPPRSDPICVPQGPQVVGVDVEVEVIERRGGRELAHGPRHEREQSDGDRADPGCADDRPGPPPWSSRRCDHSNTSPRIRLNDESRCPCAGRSPPHPNQSNPAPHSRHFAV